MFVQVIRGRVSDPGALRKQMSVWNEQVRPGAAGFLGSTAGVTDDGRLVMTARFASADAARRNGARTEQDVWWKATEALIAGPTFEDSEDLDVFLGGGSDDAGFVQVITGRATDRVTLDAMQPQLEDVFPVHRPEILGGGIVWHPGDRFTQSVYFTSEAAARQAEQREPPAELRALDEAWERSITDLEFLDLRDPWFA